ncbi:gelation factor [Heterostelium album PN500]|uniref:Gelation factor n=1 Tax=Heterostelium pallidum (strain ATCC 26659 / Pp 5 / PN500) TaxID=670386 RepID=D3B097_HETP5|nr:gelation factor [Heterostelium album PN500]EFA84721.1 gelation factor [Heterostelium album PN500]|eukprot:XP_020436833.1 gelation factor [Heterostelium album PN500]
MTETKKTWIDVQKRTFTGWANNYLKERILKINDLGTDLEDGVLLINLLEIISSKKILKFNKTPKIRLHKMENNNLAVNFIKTEGLKLVGIGAEDIVDGQLKLILGLIWTLILRYQIQMAETDSPKAALLEWVRNQVRPYGVTVSNFTDSWCDGRVLSALTDSLKPGVLDFNSLSGDSYTDVNRAMDVALEAYEIPKIMDPTDMVSLPDELSVITYVSYFRDYQVNKANRDKAAAEALEHKRRTTSDASQVLAYGPGLEAGFVNKRGDFTIKAMNYYGEPLANGGENFTVNVVGADGQVVPVTLVDNKNGTYDGHYTPSEPQDYTVTIQLDAVNVKNSPFAVKVDGSDPNESNAYGPGLEGAKVGVPAPFTIQGRNKQGDAMTQGGDDFTVKVTGPAGDVPCQVKDNGDGSYSAVYNPTKGGDHQVEVFLRGQPLAQGPVPVRVLNSDESNSFCDGPGFEAAQARRPTQFTIHSVGADGQPSKDGGDPFQVSISGPHQVDVSISDNEDGTYTVAYTPEKPGDYEIIVTLNEKPIKDIPKSIHIKPAADPNNSYAEGPGLEAGECFQPSKFKIHAVDPDGVPRNDGGDGFVVTVEGPAPVDPYMVDNGDGTYDVEFEPKVPGDYTINLTLDGDTVNGFPKVVRVKPAPAAGNSYAKGPGLKEAFDNAVAEFTIYSVDTDGNARTDGGDPFVVTIQGPNGLEVVPKVEDKNDGTYHVEYEPLVEGDYNINVTLRDTPIKDMPVTVKCIEGADGDHSSFGKFTFTVAAKNKKGEPKTYGGDKFEVSITGPAEYIELNAIDNQDGTYTAAYALVGNGRFSTAVKLNGKHIEGSPFKQVLGNPGKKNADVPSFTTTATSNSQ